jgi:hypothetical protein
MGKARGSFLDLLEYSMSNLTITDAFAKYGAELTNAMWAFSAIAEDGSLVISCWQHKFTIPEKGVLRYTDQLSRWPQSRSPGRDLFVEHLRKGYKERSAVRLVIVSTKETAIVDAGRDASKVKKIFHLKEDYVGSISSFDGDIYTIDFKKEEPIE